MKKMSPEVKLVLKTLGVVLITAVIIFFCVRHLKFSKLAKTTSLNQQIIIRALVEKKILAVQQQPQALPQPKVTPEKVKVPEKKEK